MQLASCIILWATESSADTLDNVADAVSDYAADTAADPSADTVADDTYAVADGGSAL